MSENKRKRDKRGGNDSKLKDKGKRMHARKKLLCDKRINENHKNKRIKEKNNISKIEYELETYFSKVAIKLL